MEPFRDRLRSALDDTETPAGRAVAYSVQFLIFTSMVSFSVSTMPGLSDASLRLLRWIEILTVALFTIEYVARVYVARKPLAFMFSFYGLVDLIAILPFYLALGMDLRSVRVIRMLRLFRLLKLVRYSAAMTRFHRAFLLAREELVLFGVVTAMLLFLAAVGIYYFENEAQPEAFASVPHSLWWAVATLTTVGYGDVYPVTVGGRIFTFFILMIGLGVIAVPAGMVATALARAREEAEKERQRK